ncbi:MAG: pyridine nucleotide-disulfide oxidoreductase [Caulobacteraceae bacterium]|nr:pyridine nucleotide-disulfide oxidoreductase [Caulobacteraceae bacterium]
MDQTSGRSTGPPARASNNVRPRVVIVGGGFAGVATAKRLRRANVDVVLIDKRNHQIFQPLLYQVATAVLAPSDIAAPLRQLTEVQPNLTVQMAEVIGIDVESRTIRAQLSDAAAFDVPFDFLVLAPGATPTYFGHDGFAENAPGLKTLSDAEVIRSKILKAYELAEVAPDSADRRRLTTFVIVGGGPTGVELAATIAQLARVTLRRDFRRIDPGQTQIVLLEGGKRILPSFDEDLASAARRQLNRLGVMVRTGAVAEAIDDRGVIVAGQLLPTATVIWAAGVAASRLSAQVGAQTDRAGRALVGLNLETSPGSGVFVIGDAASVLENGKAVPGVAQGALQQGDYVGKVIAARVAEGSEPAPFHYRDKGSMAVVGKDFALLEAPGVRMRGRLAWLVWAFIHIGFLPQLQNRLRVGVQWLWSYYTGQRGSRLITEGPSNLRRPDRLAEGPAPGSTTVGPGTRVELAAQPVERAP